MRVLSLHTGRSEPLRNKEGKQSAIRKLPLEGPVRLGKHGLAGDEVVDLRYHGGPFKALCAYSSEYYPECRLYAGEDMPLGSFGENLALEGLLDPDVCIGDVYQLGAARIQVAGPRGPCSTLSAHWNSKDLHLHIKRGRKTGFYLCVLQPGEVQAGMRLERLSRPLPRWTLPRFWDVFDGEEKVSEAEWEELLAIPCLDPDWRRRAPKLREH